MTMDLESLWWMDGTEYDPDPELGSFGSAFLNTLHDIAAAPVHLVAAVSPEPVKKALKASIAATNPVNLIDSGTRARTAATVADAKKTVTTAAGKVLSGGTSGGTAAQYSKAPVVNKPLALTTMAKPTVKASDFDAATLAKLRGVNEILTNVKPRLSAKSSDSASKVAGDQLLANMVSSAVAAKLGGDLSSIKGALNLAANQRLATSEHNEINSQAEFRRKVLADLMRISANLPATHPTRIRIRKVGLMSGLL